MVDLGTGSGRDRWVCPNDRQLALRAKLRTGWSVKTGSLCQPGGRQEKALDESEQAVIKEVIQRAEMLEQTEQERVGRLVERLENMKRNALGNGTNQCILCGDHFGMLSAPNLLCRDCHKAVCQKCGIETTTAHKETIALCKICSETREMWKKSGAWFFKGLPKYRLPEKKPGDNRFANRRGQQRLGMEKNTWSGNKAVTGARGTAEAEEGSSSEDELTRRSRQRGRQRQDSDSPSAKQGVTFDPSLGPVTPTSSQHLAEEMAPAAGDSLGLYARPELCPSRESLETSSSSRQPSISEQGQPMWEPEGYARRDSQSSQVSQTSREWGWDDRTSLSSSSTSGVGVSGDIPDGSLGWLEMSLVYDARDRELHCTLHRAKGLRATDINGLSDPFCRITLLPASNHDQRPRTKTVHKTRNPEFEETVTLSGVTESDIARKELWVVVLDDDRYGQDVLGEARLSLCRAIPQRHLCVCLMPGQPEADAPQILLSLCYSTRRHALMVAVLRCVALPAMDSNGLSDPFVRLRLKPDPHQRRYKTSTKWKTLNPVFNEEFALDAAAADLARRALEVTVWDKDYGKSDDFLGGLELGWRSKGERLRHWIDMIKFPDQRHEGWHSLGSELMGD